MLWQSLYDEQSITLQLDCEVRKVSPFNKNKLDDRMLLGFFETLILLVFRFVFVGVGWMMSFNVLESCIAINNYYYYC